MIVYKFGENIIQGRTYQYVKENIVEQSLATKDFSLRFQLMENCAKAGSGPYHVIETSY
jgi:hypothetical protein